MATIAGYIDFDEASAPATPAAGSVRTYAKTDGLMYQKDDAGVETSMGGGGGGIPDTILDAKGDLIAASAADTAAKLTAGANGTILMAASGETTGLKWHALTTVDATLSGDQTMTNANQFYDGPSASFIAGTWFVWYQATVVLATTGQTHDLTAKLWDGSTVYGESSSGLPLNNTSGTIGFQICGNALIVVPTTATIKVSISDIRASSVMKRNVTSNGASSNLATRMTAIRIA